MTVSCWGAFQGAIAPQCLHPHGQTRRVTKQALGQVLGHHLRKSPLAMSPLSPQRTNGNGVTGREPGRWVAAVTSREKNLIFTLPSKPYGCLGSVYCLLSISSVHWEAQRKILVTTERVGVGCTGAHVVRGSCEIYRFVALQKAETYKPMPPDVKGNMGDSPLL